MLLWDIVVHVQSVSLPKYGFAQLRQLRGGWAVQSLDLRHLWLPTIILEHDLLTSVSTVAALFSSAANSQGIRLSGILNDKVKVESAEHR